MSKEVTRAEARAFLDKQIKDWHTGWKNVEGPDKNEVTHPGAIHSIACLRWLKSNVDWRGRQKKKRKSGRGR